MDKQAKVTEIIHRVTGNDVTVDADESLFDAGILDSFALSDVIAEVEKEFDIKVPDSDLTPRKFSSISKIVGYIDSHVM
ncbi:MAG TPA: phosphopantetheine-binding protein [Bryobacteraceae bacterium]|jgi:acyl carrier protein